MMASDSSEVLRADPPPEYIQAFLDSFRSLNDGNGLLISPVLAARFRKIGITGPYLVAQLIPTGENDAIHQESCPEVDERRV